MDYRIKSKSFSNETVSKISILNRNDLNKIK